MKKKTLIICLTAVGAVLLIASLIIPLIQMNNVHTSNGTGIIGGAGLPTFQLYFRGIYPIMTFLGVGLVGAASVTAFVKKKK